MMLGVVLELILDEGQPILQVLMAIRVGHIVDEEHGGGSVDVFAEHLTANLLATDIPDLERHVDIAGEDHLLVEEVYADGLLVGLGEALLAEAVDQGGLSHGTIADYNHLELVLLDAIIITVTVRHVGTT